MERKGGTRSPDIRISDLLELGFDPTRLREWRLRGTDYIFERVSPHFLPSIERKREFLLKIGDHISESRFRNATIQTNPPLAFLRDKGNIYILRRKIGGIHLEEALDQLRTSPHLKDMNHTVRIDRAVILTVNETKAWLLKRFDSDSHEEIEDLTFFVPWNLEQNMPRVTVDLSDVSMSTLWIA
jgi:hypothetical protein